VNQTHGLGFGDGLRRRLVKIRYHAKSGLVLSIPQTFGREKMSVCRSISRSDRRHDLSYRLATFVAKQKSIWANGAAGKADEETIHQMRVALKKMTAVIRLLEFAGIATSDWERRCRSASKALAKQRDADVIQQWLQLHSMGSKKGSRHSKHEPDRPIHLTVKVAAGQRRLIRDVMAELKERSVQISMETLFAHGLRKSRNQWRRCVHRKRRRDYHRLRRMMKEFEYELEALSIGRQDAQIRELQLRVHHLGHHLGVLHDLWMIEKNLQRGSERREAHREQKVEMKFCRRQSQRVFSAWREIDQRKMAN
jgi:CHAD domain-containing protein